LALLNANLDARAFTRHPTVPTYIEGCRRRAEFHGYRFDEFWLHDPELNGERLNRMLLARGIRGALVVGLMKENQLPERFAGLWQRFPTVVTGVRTRNPTLPFACVDHHALALEAVERVVALGYRRPALVVDERIDRLVDGRFTSGMHVGQQALPKRDRVPGFYQVEEARQRPELFAAWLKRNRPDVIFTLYNVTRRWVEALGLGVPQDIGLVRLERRRGGEDWAGMDQHNDLAGEAAVDMLVGMIQRGEPVLPKSPRATLISGSWVDGRSVERRAESGLG
jgi:LacI family transcriptional regulator